MLSSAEFQESANANLSTAKDSHHSIYSNSVHFDYVLYSGLKVRKWLNICAAREGSFNISRDGFDP